MPTYLLLCGTSAANLECLGSLCRMSYRKWHPEGTENEEQQIALPYCQQWPPGVTLRFPPGTTQAVCVRASEACLLLSEGPQTGPRCCLLWRCLLMALP